MWGKSQFWASVFVMAGFFTGAVSGQDPGAPPPLPVAEPPPAPQGVEVLARGPVHEAFATPMTEPLPTQLVPRQPPKPLEEMPPDQKPEGQVVWIGGYWAWDDERKDFLWVSGTWRTLPPGKQWVAGYWHDDNGQSQWVPGFWTAAASQEAATQEVTYYPAPPAPPEVAPHGEPPTPDSFYVPGVWTWSGERYAWRAGYWARVQPGYVWVAAHYGWTPGGYVFIPGYWDLAISRRGVLFAPVVINAGAVGPTFVYTPGYVVQDTVMLDAFFVRPRYCHYYFGDYYGPVYRDYGFESCVVYSRRCYDPVFVYARWEHRADPRWEGIQVDICLGRHAGRVACPPRTLVLERGGHNPMLVPAAQMSVAIRGRTVFVDVAGRQQAREHARVVQQVAMQRTHMEVVNPNLRGPMKPRVSTFEVPAAHPVGPRPNPTISAAVTPGPRLSGPQGANNAFPGIHPGNPPTSQPGLTPAAGLHPPLPPGAHPPGPPGTPPPAHKPPPKPDPNDHRPGDHPPGGSP